MPARTVREAGGLALAALTAGCATAALPPSAEVAQAARMADSYSARLRVSLRGPALRARTAALVAFRRPAALRLEVPGPTGVRMVAVARGGDLFAVFPGDRAVFQGGASADELDALLGVSLSPAEIMDLLVGVPPPRLRSCKMRWGPVLPREIDARLPDGTRLKLKVEEAETGVALPATAFEEPPHPGYRRVDAEEARKLWR